MQEKRTASTHCSRIDEFIGQGIPAHSGEKPAGSNGTAGCAVIMEFIDQGVPMSLELPGPVPGNSPLVESSAQPEEQEHPNNRTEGSGQATVGLDSTS
jgi:hypothetical protein